MGSIKNNQMNSVYQSSMQHPNDHKTSVLSIVVLLLVAVIVAVLGFGRIKNIKEEDTQARKEASMQAEQSVLNAKKAAEQANSSDNLLLQLEASASTSIDDAIKAIESEF